MAKEQTEEERQEQLRADRRAEAHALAHDVSPSQAGDELLEGSDARKAKRRDAEAGAKQEQKKA